MVYIFMDESGDLGFKTRASDCFVFTLIFTKNYRPVEKVIKKVQKELQKKYQTKELHAYHSTNIVRKKVLKKLMKIDDLKIITIILEKNKINENLQNQRKYFYNFLASFLLKNFREKATENLSGIKIFIDQKDTNKFMKENLEKKMKENFSIPVQIEIKSSHSKKGLQAVDFVSWAIFRKYEREELEFYNLIKDKIITEEKINLQKENLLL